MKRYYIYLFVGLLHFKHSVPGGFSDTNKDKNQINDEQVAQINVFRIYQHQT
jgi:hypothetical protein